MASAAKPCHHVAVEVSIRPPSLLRNPARASDHCTTHVGLMTSGRSGDSYNIDLEDGMYISNANIVHK